MKNEIKLRFFIWKVEDFYAGLLDNVVVSFRTSEEAQAFCLAQCQIDKSARFLIYPLPTLI